MFRFLITVILGVGLAGGAAWYFELWSPLSLTETGETAATNAGHDAKPAVDVGKWLYPPAPEGADLSPPDQRLGFDPIVVPDCHLAPVNKQDVTCQRDGQILFIGQEVFQGDPNNPSNMLTATVHLGGGRDSLKVYKKLERGDVVKPGEMVGLLDPAIALNDVSSKKAKVVASQADYEAAKATHRESQFRLDRLDLLRRSGGPKAVSDEEYSAAVLLRDRYRQEEVSKREAVNFAIIDAEQSEIILRQHEIRNKMTGAGVIKVIYKQRGEAVRLQEPVMQLQNIEYLRAEGLVDVQYIERLQPGMKVSLEPTVLEAPLRVFRGHRGEITSVAISNNEKEVQIVSASEDRTVAVWGVSRYGPQRVYPQPEPVRVLACTPRGCKQNWCVTGAADGSLRLWDLDSRARQPRWVVRDYHRGAVTALAFSPDGQWFATGGEDGTINLCTTENGQLVYPFDAEHGVEQGHQGTITSLHFTPQTRLVSAGRDNTLRVWELHEKGAKLAAPVVLGRSGSVADLDVSRDGRWMLLDQGRSLQILSVADGQTMNQLQSPSGASPYETVALFSPDASLILTAGLPEGRLQLWKAPTPTSRGYEVRQFAPNERVQVTCAVFSHEAGINASASYAVSGSKDGIVYVWPVPTQDAVAQHRIEGLTLNLVERSLDASTRQVRIGVDVHNPVDERNPYGRLMPGRPVTVVIQP